MYISDNEASKVLLESQIKTYGLDGDTILSIEQEFDHANETIMLDGLFWNVAQSQGDLFSLEYVLRPNRGRVATINPRSALARYVIHSFNHVCAKQDTPYWTENKFSPAIEYYVNTAEKMGLMDLPMYLKFFQNDEIPVWVERLNAFVAEIRRIARSDTFIQINHKNKRTTNKNYQGMLQYFNRIFERYSRVLVIRIDLGYKKASSCSNDHARPVTFEQAFKDRENLFNNARFNQTIFKGLIGFLWKLEYGAEKSYHYHMLLMFDGSKVREDETIARKIGDYWNKTITQNAGVYHNCNVAKGSYRFCGIGMVSHDDVEKRENMRKAAAYLTKTDYFVKVKAPEGRRTFGKGVLPCKREGKRGRPRNVVLDWAVENIQPK